MRGKGLAETSRRHFPHAGVAREGEGFQHDLLDDQAADEVALCDAAHERVAEPLPMFAVDVIDDVHSDLAALGSEGGGVPPFVLRMLQCSAASAGSSQISDKEA